jgi:hypothetical protein
MHAPDGPDGGGFLDDVVDDILGDDLPPPRPAASSVARSNSIQATNHATRTEQLDTAVWLQWLAAFRAGDRQQAAFLRERFRPGLLRAHKLWVAKVVVAPDGKVVSAPAGTPFTEPQYVVSDTARADELAAEAEQQLADSRHAASMSTKYVLIVVLLALVLFFAGIATKFRNPKLQARSSRWRSSPLCSASSGC